MKIRENIEKKLDYFILKKLSMEYYRAMELLYSNYLSYKFREHLNQEDLKKVENPEREVAKRVNQELKPLNELFTYVKKSIQEYVNNEKDFRDPVVLKYYAKSLVQDFEKTNKFFEKHVMPYLSQKLENKKSKVITYDKEAKKIYVLYTTRFEEMNNLYRNMQKITETLKKAIS